MKMVYSVGVCAAIAMTLNMVVFAQQTANEEQTTVTGCIQREADYRRAAGAGRAGAAGTGVGAANEFVLVNASIGSASGTAGTAGSATTERNTATTGTSAMGTAYELTGANEGQVDKYVGQRVEVSGKLKAAAVTPSGQPTGGATAGKPPAGVDIAGRDLQLRELEVSTVRQIAGTCPTQ